MPCNCEMLRRITAGASDLEIAPSLFAGRRTAATHVAAILGKPALCSRAAAAFPVRHGLA